jgi:hypothetical protein
MIFRIKHGESAAFGAEKRKKKEPRYRAEIWTTVSSAKGSHELWAVLDLNFPQEGPIALGGAPAMKQYAENLNKSKVTMLTDVKEFDLPKG